MTQHQSKPPYQRIGLDKIRFYDFTVSNMDISYFLDDNRITVYDVSDPVRVCRWHEPSGNGISKIIVKDNQMFSDLIIVFKNGTNIRKDNVYLTVTKPKTAGNNLDPWSWTEYDNYLHKVFSYIESEYHIVLDWEGMKVKYMEINCNIPLEAEFCLYNRPIRLLMSLQSKRMKKINTYEAFSGKNRDKSAHGESFKRGNKSVEIIIYDKLQDLIDKGRNYDSLDTPILRIEYRLQTWKKIKQVFGMNYWKDLNDKLIADYFITQIRTQFAKKYAEWEKHQHDELKKMVVACHSASPKKWHDLLMQEVRNQSEKRRLPFILDIEQVHEAIRALYKKNVKRKCKAIDDIKINEDVYKNNDREKVREILIGAEQAYKNTIEPYSGTHF